eukprot:12893044-Prorocentrum_lima.AAC.1
MCSRIGNSPLCSGRSNGEPHNPLAKCGPRLAPRCPGQGLPWGIRCGGHGGGRPSVEEPSNAFGWEGRSGETKPGA